MQAEASENNVDISFQPSDLPQVAGIRTQIAQVIVNLLRNAIEAMASTPNKQRSIKITTERGGAFVTVIVEDNGPGVDPDLELFSQFETTKADGMGLGLSICRSIVETGGGQMWHETSDGSGARFCFTVPVAQSDQ